MRSTDKSVKIQTAPLSSQNTYVCENEASFSSVIEPFLPVLDAEKKTVIITDPFLFPTSGDDAYYQELTELLKKLKCTKIIYATNKTTVNRFENLATALQESQITLCKITVTSKIHDRFWICPETKKGFFTGTSPNGFADSLSLINQIPEVDVIGIMNSLKSKGVTWTTDPT